MPPDFGVGLPGGAGCGPGPADSSPDAALEKVLGQMDSAAEKFRTTEASVVWDQFQKIVEEHEEQKGKVYFPALRQ